MQAAEQSRDGPKPTRHSARPFQSGRRRCEHHHSTRTCCPHTAQAAAAASGVYVAGDAARARLCRVWRSILLLHLVFPRPPRRGAHCAGDARGTHARALAGRVTLPWHTILHRHTKLSQHHHAAFLRRVHAAHTPCLVAPTAALAMEGEQDDTQLGAGGAEDADAEAAAAATLVNAAGAIPAAPPPRAPSGRNGPGRPRGGAPNAGPGTSGHGVCRVPGCGTDLTGANKTQRRCRVCSPCMQAAQVRVPGSRVQRSWSLERAQRAVPARGGGRVYVTMYPRGTTAGPGARAARCTPPPRP